MSSTYDLLNQIQEERLARYSTIPARNFNEPSRASWLIALLVGIVVIVLSAAMGFLFLKVQAASSEKDAAVTQLSKMEDSLNSTNRRVDIISNDISQIRAGMDQINRSLVETDNKIKKIEEGKDAQSASLENLTKAKNTLFNRLNELEVKLEGLKQQVASPSSN